MHDHSQPELDFAAPAEGSGDGYAAWQQKRADAMRRSGLRLGLPIGKRVEVWLKGEIRLIGVLRIKDSLPFVQAVDADKITLLVDNVPFAKGDITSCIRLDE